MKGVTFSFTPKLPPGSNSCPTNSYWLEDNAVFEIHTSALFFVSKTNMECKILNFGRNIDISQTLLICAGYIDMNYDASRLSQIWHSVHQKNFQSPKVSKLQSMWWSGENGRGGNFFIWNGHRRPIAPPHPPQAPSESELFVCRLHRFPGKKEIWVGILDFLNIAFSFLLIL